MPGGAGKSADDQILAHRFPGFRHGLRGSLDMNAVGAAAGLARNHHGHAQRLRGSDDVFRYAGGHKQARHIARLASGAEAVDEAVDGHTFRRDEEEAGHCHRESLCFPVSSRDRGQRQQRKTKLDAGGG